MGYPWMPIEVEIWEKAMSSWEEGYKDKKCGIYKMMKAGGQGNFSRVFCEDESGGLEIEQQRSGEYLGAVYLVFLQAYGIASSAC